MRWGSRLILAVASLAGWIPHAQAYTATGDRQFPATILLPQIGPSDEAYLTGASLPQAGDPGGPNGRTSSFAATIDKTITDRLSLTVTEEYSAIDPGGGPTVTGWQNTTVEAQYTLVANAPHELLLSVGVQREFPYTGAQRVGAAQQGATLPMAFFGKGFGDLDLGLLRPLAIGGYAGFNAADKAPRTSAWNSGFFVEYSIPYLEANVRTFDMPDFLRNLTPMVEVSMSNPVGSAASSATMVIAPGFNYSGEGWDFGIEALVPTSRAAGVGTGVTAQLHIQLDYLFPRSLGRPLF